MENTSVRAGIASHGNAHPSLRFCKRAGPIVVTIRPGRGYPGSCALCNEWLSRCTTLRCGLKQRARCDGDGDSIHSVSSRVSRVQAGARHSTGNVTSGNSKSQNHSSELLKSGRAHTSPPFRLCAAPAHPHLPPTHTICTLRSSSFQASSHSLKSSQWPTKCDVCAN